MEITKIKKDFFSKEQIIYGIAGLLLGLAPLAKGIMPFGCAFLCAVPKKRRNGAFLGVALASLFDEFVPLGLFCAVYLFFVFNAKEKNGGVYFSTRILLALSVSALRSAYILVTGIHLMSDVFRLLCAIIAYPAFTLAFMGYFDKKRELHPKRYDLSLLAFAFAFSILLSDIEIGNCSLSLVPAAAFTLCAARTKGFAFGGVCGVVCGLASGGAATGALGVLGMTYGLLVNEIEPLALLLSFMLGLTGHYYLSGSFGFLPALIMMIIVYGFFIPFRKRLEIYRQKNAPSEKRAHDRRLARYAAAFSSLSSLFYTVSDTTKEESITDVNQKIVNAVDYYCQRCQGCNLDKSEISNFFTSELRRCGIAAYSRIPQHISASCPNACAMAKAVNNLREVRAKEGEKGLKQMAEEYSAFSSLLVDAQQKQEDSVKNDKPLADKIKKVLDSIDVYCDGVRVKGIRQREITVFGVKPDKMSKSPEEISKAVSNIVGTAVSLPEMILHEDYTLMRLYSVPCIKVEFAKISEAKNGETVCGDTVSVFENQDKYLYCLVSDGMGSGRDAALTSRLSAIMLEKLLAVGAEKESALRLLNKALVEKQEEVFATVDLLEIDRINATATLIKAGAAPTVLIREGRSMLIEAKTPPAGIMRQVIAYKKTFKLQKGDMIVMLSDGILQTGSENNIFPEKGIPPLPSARALALKILRDARSNALVSDDMSVCALRVF